MKIKCKCGEVHEINLASAFAKLRTDKMTQKERKELGRRLALARKNKKLSEKTNTH